MSECQVYFFSQVTSDRVRENGLTLHQGPFRLVIREKFSTKNLVKQWKRVPKEVMKSLEILKRHVHMVLWKKI